MAVKFNEYWNIVPEKMDEIDAVFAATDGLYTCLTDEEIQNVLTKYEQPALAINKMFKIAREPKGIIPIFMDYNNVSNEKRARKILTKDDLTGIVIRIVEGK